MCAVLDPEAFRGSGHQSGNWARHLTISPAHPPSCAPPHTPCWQQPTHLSAAFGAVEWQRRVCRIKLEVALRGACPQGVDGRVLQQQRRAHHIAAGSIVAAIAGAWARVQLMHHLHQLLLPPPGLRNMIKKGWA